MIKNMYLNIPFNSSLLVLIILISYVNIFSGECSPTIDYSSFSIKKEISVIKFDNLIKIIDTTQIMPIDISNPIKVNELNTLPINTLIYRHNWGGGIYSLYKGRYALEMFTNKYQIIKSFKLTKDISLKEIIVARIFHRKPIMKGTRYDDRYEIKDVFFGKTSKGNILVFVINRDNIFFAIKGEDYQQQSIENKGVLKFKGKFKTEITICPQSDSTNKRNIVIPTVGIVKMSDVDAGFYNELNILLAGYITENRPSSFFLPPGDTLLINCNLEPICQDILIHSIYKNTKYSLFKLYGNNVDSIDTIKSQALTPYTFTCCFGEKYIVEFKKEGFAIKKYSITAKSSFDTTYSYELERVGYLNLSVVNFDEFKYGEVKLNDSIFTLRNKNNNFELYPAKYTLINNIENYNMIPKGISFSIDHNFTIDTTVTFMPPYKCEEFKKIVNGSLFFPGLGRIFEDGLFSTGTLEFISEWGIIITTLVLNHRKKISYDNWKNEKEINKRQDYYEDFVRYKSLSIVGLINIICGYTGSFIDSFFYFKRRRSECIKDYNKFSIYYDNDNFTYKLCINFSLKRPYN